MYSVQFYAKIGYECVILAIIQQADSSSKTTALYCLPFIAFHHLHSTVQT